MSARVTRTAAPLMAAAVIAMVLGAVLDLQAQGGGRGRGRGLGGPPAPPGRAGAPVDLTGTWVSVVTEDWQWRMVTPKKGDVSSVPLNPAGIAAANAWDPSQDGKCEAYGVGGIMRMPTRLKISWQDDLTLKIETDAGQQTRLLHFAPQGTNIATAPGPRSLQGYSVAEWERSAATFDAFMGGVSTPGSNSWGTLKVTTTNMLPAWLRRNGVPYSQNTTVSETFMRITHPEAGDWFVVRTVVEDPTYLRGTYITSSNFKKEPNDSKWSPTACKS
jgi:hypothetical protein